MSVRIFPGLGERDPTAMLECAKTAALREVLVIGLNDDGLFVSASCGSMRDVAWLLAKAQAWLAEEIS